MFSRNTMSLLGLLMAAMLGFALVTPAQAIEYSWVGGDVGGDLWSLGANWTPLGPPETPPPVAGDTARFGLAGELHPTVTIDGAQAASTLIFESSAVNYSLAGSGTLTISITLIQQTQKDSAISASLALGANVEVNVASVAPGFNNLTVSGPISGGILTKTGEGTLTLSGNNTYGDTVVLAGTLKLQNGAFSATNRNYSIATNAVLNLDGNITPPSGTSTITGTGTLRFTGGSFERTSDGGQGNVTMSLGAGAKIDVQAGARLVSGGWGTINWDSNLASLNVDGTFNVWSDRDTYVDALTGSGIIAGKWNSDRALIVGVNGGSGNFTGVMQNGEPGDLNPGRPTLTKRGSGTQILSNANTYTGNTNVNEGTLALAHPNAVSGSNVIVNGGTLSLRANDNTTFTAAGFALGNGTVDVRNNGSGTDKTLSLGAVSTYNNGDYTVNFTGDNGYLLTMDSFSMNPWGGQNTRFRPTTTSLVILGNVNNPMSGYGDGNYDTLYLEGTSSGNRINGVISDAVGANPKIAGFTRVCKNDTSIWTLAGANTYSGDMEIRGGTLRAGVASVPGVSGPFGLNTTILLTEGATMDLAGYNTQIGSLRSDSDTTGGAVLLGGATLSVGTDNSNRTFSGSIGLPGETGSLVKVGTGYATLRGTNNYSGGTTVLGGILQFVTDAQLGAVPTSPMINITLNGGELFSYWGDGEPNLPVNRQVYLGAGGGSIRAGYGKTFTINGKITGPGSFGVVWDGNPVVLTNNTNDYIGDTVIGGFFNDAWGSTARLRAGVTNPLPYGTGKGDLRFAPTGSNYFEMNTSGAYNVQINGLVGGNAGVPGTDDGSIIDGGYGAVLTVGNADHGGVYGGIIRGDMGLIKVGSGTQTLSGNNDYGRDTTVNGGTLILAGDNNNWGTTRVNAGTLSLQNVNALKNAYLDTGGAGTVSFELPGANTYYIGALEGSGTLAIGANTISVMGRWATFSGTLGVTGDTGGLVKTNGDDFYLTGANNYSGGTTINGGIVRIATDASLGAVPASPTVNLTLNGGQLMNSNSSPVLNANRTIYLGPSGGGIRNGWGDRNGGQTLTVNGKITGPGALTIVWDGAAVILANNTGDPNDYQGNTIVGGSFNGNSGDTSYLKLGATNVLPYGTGKGNLVFASTGNNYFNLNGFSTQINGLIGNGNTNNFIDNRTGGGNPVLTVGDNNQDGSFNGLISNTTGSLGLTKVGTGTLTLNSANTYTGRTLVNNGTLAVNNVRALQGSTLNLSGAGAVNLAVGGVNTYYLGGLEGTNPLDIKTNTLHVGGNNQSTTFSGALSSTGATGSGGTLWKDGSGTLRLAGANTIKGGIELSGTGTLPGVLGSTLVIANGSSLGAHRATAWPLLFDGAAPPTMVTGAMVAGRLAGNWNTTDPNPANRIVYNGLQEQTVNTQSDNSAVVDYPTTGGRLWVDNSTWVYQSMINITTAGTYSFAEHFDDNAKLVIDGNTVFQWGSQDQGQIYLTTGTHALEMRFGQGGGGVGPYNGNGADYTDKAISLGYYQGATTNYGDYTQLPTSMLSTVVSNWRSVVFEHGADGSLGTTGWTTELNAYWPIIMVDGAVLGGAVNDAAGSTPLVNKINDTFTVTDMTVGLRADRIKVGGSTVGSVNFSNVTLTASDPGVSPGSTLYLLGDAGVTLGGSTSNPATGNLTVGADSTIVNQAAYGRIRNASGTGNLTLTGAKPYYLGGTLALPKITAPQGVAVTMDDPGTDVSGMGVGGIEINGATLTVATAVTGNTTYHINGPGSGVRVREGGALGTATTTGVQPLIFTGGSAPVATGLAYDRVSGQRNWSAANTGTRMVYNGLDEVKIPYNPWTASPVIDYPNPGDRLWADEATLIYTGTINIPTTGQYTFGSNIDDDSYMTIDGAVVLQQGGNNQQIVTKTLSAGTHTFEMRFSNGGGGMGPWGNGWDTAQISLGYAPGVATDLSQLIQIPYNLFNLRENWQPVIYEGNANGAAGSAGWSTELSAWWSRILNNGVVFGGLVNDAAGSTPIVNRINDNFEVPAAMTVGLRADRVTGAGGAVGSVNFSNVTLNAGATLYLLGDANVMLGGGSGSLTAVSGVGTLISNSAEARIRNTSGAGDLLLTGAKQYHLGGTLANNKITISAGGLAIMDDPGTSIGGLAAGIVIGTNSTLTVATTVSGSGTYNISGVGSVLRVKEGASLGTGSTVKFTGGSAPTYSAGLLAGRLQYSSDPPPYNDAATVSNPANIFFTDGILQQTWGNSGWEGSPVINYPTTGGKLWQGQDQCWAYSGRLLIPADDTYSIGANFDDWANLIIDGKQVLDARLGAQTILQTTLTAGWHDIDVRFGNGTGGIGGADGWQDIQIALGIFRGTTTSKNDLVNIGQGGYDVQGLKADWRTVYYETGQAGNPAGWSTGVNWAASLDNGALLSVLVNEVASGSTPLLNKLTDDFNVAAGLGVGLAADRGSVTGAVPGVVEFSNVTLGAGASLYLLSRNNANILVDVNAGGAGAKVIPFEGGGFASHFFIGDVGGTGTMTVAGAGSLNIPTTFVGTLNGTDLDVTNSGGMTIGSLTTTGGTRSANLGGRTLSIKAGVGSVLVDPAAGTLAAAAPRVSGTSTSGLDILMGQDGSTSP